MEVHSYEDGVSVKEFIIALLKNWRIILVVTLIVSIIGGVYAFMLAKPVYKSEIVGTISIPATVESKYGFYMFPTTNPQSYIAFSKSERVLSRTINELKLDLSVDNLKKNISISSDKETGYFSIRITASTPEEAQTLVQVLTDIFIEELNVIYKEKAADQFILNFNEREQIIGEQIILLQRNLEKTEIMLKPHSPMIDQGVINPVYETLQVEIVSLKLQLDDLEITAERNEAMLSELKEEKEKILAYQLGNDLSVLNDGVLDITKSRVSIDQKASFSETPDAPRKIFILAISFAFGAILSLLIAFLKVYWKGELKS